MMDTNSDSVPVFTKVCVSMMIFGLLRVDGFRVALLVTPPEASAVEEKSFPSSPSGSFTVTMTVSVPASAVELLEMTTKLTSGTVSSAFPRRLFLVGQRDRLRIHLYLVSRFVHDVYNLLCAKNYEEGTK